MEVCTFVLLQEMEELRQKKLAEAEAAAKKVEAQGERGWVVRRAGQWSG